MFPILRVVDWYSNDMELLDTSNLVWKIPMFFMSGICFALTMWIANNYIYAKLTGEFTPENHHHDHD